MEEEFHNTTAKDWASERVESFLTFTSTGSDKKINELQESCTLILLVVIQPLIH
jgi:hypothetical protein